MKKRIMLLSAVVISLLVLSSNVSAHHASVGSGIGQAGPVNTVSASTLKKGEFNFQLLTEYQEFDTFSDHELLEFAERGKEGIHNAEYLFSPSAGIAYGVNDDFTVHLRIPYVSRNNISEVHHHDDGHAEEGEEHEIEHLGDAKGFGDISVFGHYRFLNQPTLSSSLLAGLKMPTGKKSDRTDTGELFDAEFQPGSGSWDPMIGIAVTKPLGSFSLDSNILYTFVTEGVQDTDLGDIFNYNISVAYRALSGPFFLDLILEANGIWRQKEEVDGEKSENSGGNIVLISPGIKAAVNKRTVIYFSIGLPVVQDLNGEQNEIDYRTVLGISILL